MKKSNFMFRSLLLFATVMLCAWPLFALVVTVWNFRAGEGAILDAWELEPLRLLLARLLAGYLHSAVVVVPLALLAVVDFQLLVRRLRPGYPRVSRYFAGFLFAGSGVLLSLFLLQDYPDILVPVLLTACILWLAYRVFIFVFRMAR